MGLDKIFACDLNLKYRLLFCIEFIVYAKFSFFYTYYVKRYILDTMISHIECSTNRGDRDRHFSFPSEFESIKTDRLFLSLYSLYPAF
jgi:hypothetical protein